MTRTRNRVPLPKASLDVLFVQLPCPRAHTGETASNTPLASAYLASYLRARAPKISWKILSSGITDTAGDAALVRLIARQRARVVAFSLYLWNSERSLEIARRVREVCPSTRFLFGGPEITADNHWILAHEGFDVGVIGEGESLIVSTITRLRSSRSNKIPRGTLLSAPLVDLHEMTRHPYLDGLVKPTSSGHLWLEFSRGCAFRCRYCYYHKSSPTRRAHPKGLLEKALRKAFRAGSGVREIYLMDPTWNRSPDWRTWLGLIAALQERRRRLHPRARPIALHAEVRADLLTPEDVDLMRASGFNSVEAGLQSIHARVLKTAGRSMNLDAFVWGVGALQKAGIRVITDLIIGLPDDSPQGLRASAAWLKKTNAYDEVHPFLLCLLPGTSFRADAKRLGLSYSPRPPYLLRETPNLSSEDLKRLTMSLSSKFHLRPLHAFDSPSRAQNTRRARFLHSLTLNLGRQTDHVKSLTKAASRLGDVVDLTLRSQNFEGDHAILEQLLPILPQANPFTVWRVWLEGSLAPPQTVDLVTALLAHPPHYLNRFFNAFSPRARMFSVQVRTAHSR